MAAINKTEQQSTTTAPSMMPPPTAAFERLLDQADPRGQALGVTVREARRLCGRWLAWSRLQMGLTNEHITQATDLDEQTLLLLESGLADPAQVSDTTRSRLSRMLAAMPRDEKWVLKVLSIALGQYHESDEQILQQITTELSSATTSLKISGQEYEYELFRRAIVERDEDAWALVAARYRHLLIAWVARCPALVLSGERCEDLAVEALARARTALSPERFAAFPNLPALLAYLRVCVATTVIDAARNSNMYERLFQRVEHTASMSVEQVVLERLRHAELWQIVTSHTRSEAERIALYERFVLSFPPRTIQARHPTLFPDVMAVDMAIRNLCYRLRRNDELRQICQNRLSPETT